MSHDVVRLPGNPQPLGQGRAALAFCLPGGEQLGALGQQRDEGASPRNIFGR